MRHRTEMPILRSREEYIHLLLSCISGGTTEKFNRTKWSGPTSKIMMRVLVAVIAIAVLGLTATGTAFACPFMTAPPPHEEPCSECPKQESCPPEACLLLCPYTVERTAIVSIDEHYVPFLPAVVSTLHFPALTRVQVVRRAPTRELGSGELYLRNCVFLI